MLFVAWILFYIVTLIHPVIRKAPVHSTSFFKLINYILRHTNIVKTIYDIKILDFIVIFFTNIIGIFVIYFFPIWYMKYILKSNKPFRLKEDYLYPIFVFYGGTSVFFAIGYWRIYNIYPLEKTSVIAFLWGNIIFHSIFEIGLQIILSFYFINTFLLLYNNYDNNIDYNLFLVKKRFHFLINKIPIISIILFISAIIECMDL